jgi:hypothetical protein
MIREIACFFTVIGWCLASSPLLALQQKPPPPPPAPKIDEAKVEAAIKSGLEYLKANTDKMRVGGKDSPRELVLLTMIHSGVRRGDPLFDGLLREMLEEDLRFTYRVALQAMVLEELDRVRYQRRLFQCGQFLVDNQCANGQWTYGQATNYPEPSLGGPREIATGAVAVPGKVVMFQEPEPGQKPAVLGKIPVKKQRDGPGTGDNSNSQYAALGLRACHDSGIVFPGEVIQKAAKWWHDSQNGDSPGAPQKGARVATGPVTAEPRGWNYKEHEGASYGSMTAGAVGALVICDYILGTDWKRDNAVQSGIAWLRDNFAVKDNPKHGNKWHYYYLYGLERAGMLYGTEKFGDKDWYFEGAKYLLDSQDKEGSWGSGNDTCFAILFLRKATRALTESRDSSRKK